MTAEEYLRGLRSETTAAGRPSMSSRGSSRRTRTPTASSAARPRGSMPATVRFAMQMAYGTVQRVRTLDHAIETVGRRPVRKLDPPCALHCESGLPLAFMDGVPAHAAVDESVELVRRAGPSGRRVHERGVCGGFRRACPRCSVACTRRRPPPRRSCTPIPTGCRDVVARARPGGGPALMRRQNEPPRPPCGRRGPEVVDAIPPDWVASGYPGLRAVLAARRRSRGSAGRRARARPLRSAGREGDPAAAAGAEVVAVEKHPAARGSSRRTRAGSASS